MTIMKRLGFHASLLRNHAQHALTLANPPHLIAWKGTSAFVYNAPIEDMNMKTSRRVKAELS